MTREELMEGIDDDGLVEDQMVETYYCELEYVHETKDFLRIGGDNGGENVEIRVPVAVLLNAGWTRPERDWSQIKRETPS